MLCSRRICRYVVRDPVKIDHAVSVRLKDGRDVQIVTRSDFSILLAKDYITITDSIDELGCT